MEIEVGEYVRNEDGYIWQIKKTKDLDNIFIDEDGKVKEIAGETVFGDDVIVEITKHSRDIIDLVEAGDYINGNRVENVSVETNEVLLDHNGFGWRTLKDGDKIVTHEQFESIEYKVEEDR